ncbi:MAG: LLM class flavin-dependent oxidoreductase [Candidatus Binatia bacterium]|nr:LLM class flavin-dependent oxidoreductase [Candidatus Binatia bacterium]
MQFHLFIYATVGRRHEIEAGMAGQRPELYQRMLEEIAEYARFADEAGFAGLGHPEHHLQIEGFEASNEPGLLAMWIGQHSKRLRVDMVGWVAPTHNPVRVAEYTATLDHMLKGRLGVGLVRGYQARWVHTFRIRPDLNAVGEWNRNSPDDNINRDYFKEFVEIVLTAWTKDTFSYRGRYWTIPPDNFVNPHVHPAYTKYGRGVDENMHIREIGIAPKPLQRPHPPLYGGFTHSMRTALFWARYGGKPIVLASDLEFCKRLWHGYREEAAKHGRQVEPGDEAAWGGTLVVAPTKTQAQEWAQDMVWLWNEWLLPFGQGYPEMLVGDPDSISRRLEEASAAIPIKECFLLIPQGIHERDQILTSLELFATKVMPRFAA